jgi:hypothetical protein
VLSAPDSPGTLRGRAVTLPAGGLWPHRWCAAPLAGRAGSRLQDRRAARRPPAATYSTVTLLARFRGWSTSHPRRTARW